MRAADNPHMKNSVTDILMQVIEERGLTWEAAALICHLERSYFRKLFERKGASPRGATLRKISEGLGVPVAVLLGDEKMESAARLPSVAAYPAEPGKDVPVIGTVGETIGGAFQLSANPVDHVRRPCALINARNVYALFVEGSLMEPQFYPGDLIFVHPDRPPRLGDAVVVRCRRSRESPIEASIGILLARDGEVVALRRHSPPAKIEIDRATVVAVHKILSLNEIYGV